MPPQSNAGLATGTIATIPRMIMALALPRRRSVCCRTSSRTHAASSRRSGRNLAMPTLDLPPNHLRVLLDLLRQNVPDAEVWAYGSRVNHTAHEASDLDL